LRQRGLPPDRLAEDQQSAAPAGGTDLCGVALRELPQHDGLDKRNVRSQHDGILAHEWPRERPLRFLPHQQQLQFADCSERLWQRGLPLDRLAEDQQPGALDFWPRVRSGELRELPHDGRLGQRFV